MIKRALFILCLFLPLTAHAEAEVQEVHAGGVTAWLVEDHHVPALQVIVAFKEAGYASDEQQKQGRAALATAMLLEGAGERDALAFHQAMENKAISIATSLSNDIVQLSMRSLSEFGEDAFTLLGDVLLHPRYDNDRMADVKAQIRAARMRQQESPYYLAGQAFDKMAYGPHPYANEKLGSEETVAALTREQLLDYHQRFFTKDNIVISVAGDIDADTLKDYLKLAFGDLPKHLKADHPISPVTLPDQALSQHIAKALPQTVILFGQQGIMRNAPQFYAAYVLNYIVGGGSLTSRLGEEVRKARGLTYGINTNLHVEQQAASWQGLFATKSESVKEARQAAREVLEKVQKEGVTQAERDHAVQYITGSFPLQIDSNAAIAGYLSVMQLYDLGKDYLKNRNAIFESVTLDQINHLAKNWLKPEQMLVITVGDVVPQASPATE